jgi:phosphatidylinositol alpha-1,6-mannosyltransferase
VSHLLVTNDFPPKVGGIQTYLWELWRRLPPGETTVLTTSFQGDVDFDRAAPMPVVRASERLLLPKASLARRIDELAAQSKARLVVLDPALPLGLVGCRLKTPYAVVLHGAEVTVPGRLPVTSGLLRRVLRSSVGVIAAGNYPASEARRLVRDSVAVEVVMPGVDTRRFRVLGGTERKEARARWGVDESAFLVVSVSRLVPRKGMDTLVEAAALLAGTHPDLTVLVAGDGRDRRRLEAMARRSKSPVRFLGAVGGDALPALYGCADVFVMACRNRWAGLEQEGFGVVFLEAAACGIPQVAGRSGGSDEAVVDGVTGVVLGNSRSSRELAGSLSRLIEDPEGRLAMGKASRRRAEESFDYDFLAGVLLGALRRLEGASTQPGE